MLRTYNHPYIVTSASKENHSKDHADEEDFYVWKFVNPTTQPTLLLNLQTKRDDRLQVLSVTEKYMLTRTAPTLYDEGLFVYRIEDGLLTDSMTLSRASGEEAPIGHPLSYLGRTVKAGDATFLKIVDNIVAIFRIGLQLKLSSTIIETYKISEDGKFVPKDKLILAYTNPIMDSWKPSWSTPDAIRFSETEYVGQLQLGSNHDIHFFRWTSNNDEQLPRHGHYRAGLETDEEEAEHFCSWLKTNIDLSASPSGCFITAHEEGDCRDQYPPYTLLRSIDPITLELNWSTPVEHYSFGLYAYEPLGLLVMFGRDYDSCYLTAIDIRTGAIRRREKTGKISESVYELGHVSSKGEVVMTKSNGEMLIFSLSDFMEHGYPTCNGDDKGHISHILPFDPQAQVEVHTSVPQEGKQTREDWVPIGGSHFGDGVVLLRDQSWAQYAIVSWIESD